jgi:hypothetical protein
MLFENKFSLDSAEIIYNKFPEALKNSALGAEVVNTIKVKRAVVVGNKAPVLNGLDINGKVLRSEDYIGGKYVLLDFWYVACPHCHDAFPYLNTLYDKYGKSGLEMVGISIDTTGLFGKKILLSRKLDDGNRC